MQPMIGGIISAFKRHYRHYHLQNVVDRDDIGLENIYKVNQPTAMKWSRVAWEEISMDAVANCSHHTGLFAVSPPLSVPIIEEQNLEDDLYDALLRPPLNNPMTMDDLLNPVIEDDIANLELKDDAIVAMVKEAEEEDKDLENENVEVHEITKEEKIKGLAIAASLLDVTDPIDKVVFRRIRELQNSLSTTVAVQNGIISWFLSK